MSSKLCEFIIREAFSILKLEKFDIFLNLPLTTTSTSGQKFTPIFQNLKVIFDAPDTCQHEQFCVINPNLSVWDIDRFWQMQTSYAMKLYCGLQKGQVVSDKKTRVLYLWLSHAHGQMLTNV